ncbi:MAG: FAD-dependent oxidoreductase, partial [Caulobacteraceae bacterium]
VLEQIVTTSGETLAADAFVFACGAWLPKVFPDLLENRIFPTRQEVFYFATPPGDGRFHPREFPAWAELIDGELVYGFPNLEERGFKMALDLHGPRFDPDLGDRLPTEAGMAAARAYLARRFPLLAKAPLNEARVCQYENTSNGDFLIDRHPRWANVVLLGGGSGHGFKHGPVVGSEAAALLLDPARATDRELTLAAKGTVQTRAVH